MKYLRRFPYWYLIILPGLLWSLGLLSNQAVLIANHGKFPVMMNPSWMESKCSPTKETFDILQHGVVVKKQIVEIPKSDCSAGGPMIDQTHSVMGPDSHLKALADIFPLGDAIYSIGDAFLMIGGQLLSFTMWMWLALTIRKIYVAIP